jgi:hypothetical protein
VVNPAPDPAARDVAVVHTPGGLLLATLDVRGAALSFYARHGDVWERVPGPSVPGAGAARLVAGDLNGDGLDDLVVTAEGSSQVLVYLQTPAGTFAPAPDYQLSTGTDPSDVALLDLDGDHRLDIVATSRVSGAVSVFLNTLPAPFATELRFGAGGGLAEVKNQDHTFALLSQDAPAGLVAGDFNGDGAGDLVVTHSGANTFSVLSGSGLGGFLNPQSARNFTTGSRPTVVVAGHFNGDPYLDLAILNQDSGDVSVFLGDGHGGFAPRLRLAAGNQPTGLAVADVNGDGKADLLVGNGFGDVLALLGNGDGSFQPYQRADRHIALAVADLNGDGQDDFVFGDEALDRVSVTFGQSGQHIVGDRHDGLLAPGAVGTADLNGDGIPDLVVANSGANSVLVYLGTGHGQFGPAQSFFAGTNPVGFTIALLNDDLVPDPAHPGRLIDPTPDLVVANQGSNDVTVLLGQGQGAHWALSNGPRLRLFDPATGQSGIGPVSTTVQDVTGDGIPDLLVSNPQSDNVFQIDGLGRGLFNDQAPVVFASGAGSAPVRALVGQFDSRAGLDLLTIDSGSNSLTLFSDFSAPRTLGSGGQRPVAALVGDFNHDGLPDLVVANNDDGRVALLLGTVGGPVLTRVFSTEGLAHPTDLALSEDGRQLYVTSEGAEAVARFSLDFGTAIPVPVGPGGFGPGEPVQRLAEVLPLSESTLATVATLVTVAGGETSPVGGVVAEPRSPVPLLVAATVSAPALVPALGGDAAQTAEPPLLPAVLPIVDTEAATDSLMIGLDEALKRSGAELRQRLLEEELPARGGVVDAARVEGFRQGLADLGTELEALGRRLRLVGADRLGPAGSLGNTLAGMAGSLTTLPETNLRPCVVQPFLPAAPAAGQPASSSDLQRPVDEVEARLWENEAAAWNDLLVAGLVWGFWLYHQTLSVQQHRPVGRRGRPRPGVR